MQLDMVAHACNPTSPETDAGRFRVQGQPGLHKKTLSQKKKMLVSIVLLSVGYKLVHPLLKTI
jgi:hypothetical protein